MCACAESARARLGTDRIYLGLTLRSIATLSQALGTGMLDDVAMRLEARGRPDTGRPSFETRARELIVDLRFQAARPQDEGES